MIRNYLTLAVKVLMRRKFFTFVSLFGISFTLMILVVAAAFLDNAFTAQSPQSRFDRVLWMEHFRMRSPDFGSNWNDNGSYYLLDHYIRPLEAQSGGAVEKISVFGSSTQRTTYLNGDKIEFELRLTDGAYWQILDFEFLEGVPLTEDDDRNRNFVAVINEAMRERFFKGEAAAGKTISFDGDTYRVVGVVKNPPESRQVAFGDVWAPISTRKDQTYRDTPTSNGSLMGGYETMLLARSSADFQAVRQMCKAALDGVQFPNPKEFSLMESLPHTAFSRTATRTFSEWETQYSTDYSSTLWLAIVVSALFFMFLPTINLVNLNMSRIMERASEIGVRKAFGASGGALVGQFIIENIFLTVIGGVIGFLLSLVVLNALNQSGWYRYADFTLNWRVFLYGFLLTLVFGIISGVYPAWRMSRLNPVQALKGGTR